jgi:hypothetical protein
MAKPHKADPPMSSPNTGGLWLFDVPLGCERAGPRVIRKCAGQHEGQPIVTKKLRPPWSTAFTVIEVGRGVHRVEL